jgi:hypothetical protein
MGWLWSLLTVVGPLLLLSLFVWATLRNRNAPRSNRERAERGAKEVREDIDQDPRYD